MRAANGVGGYNALGVLRRCDVAEADERLERPTHLRPVVAAAAASTVNLMPAAQPGTVRWTNRRRHAAAGQLSWYPAQLSVSRRHAA